MEELTLELLKANSPFFIADIVAKFGFKSKTVWNFIKYHENEFTKVVCKQNKSGRPPIKYMVKTDAVQSQPSGSGITP